MKITSQNLQGILDAINDAVIVFNDKLEIRYINEYGKSLFDIENDVKNLKFLDKDVLKIIKSKSSIFTSDIKNSVYEFEYKKDTKKYIFAESNKYIFEDTPLDVTVFKDYTKLHRDNQLKSCIYKISEATHYSSELDQLYEKIHNSLTDLIETKNFYIALADWEHNIIHFPYFVDQYDHKPESKLIENGLTEYVLKEGESILVNPEQYDSICTANNIEIKGRSCIDWLGVPLKTDAGITIGVLVVQSYDKNIRFKEEDKKVLQFISDQIAMAIKRKKNEIEIKQQAYYDTLTGLTNRSLFNDRLNQAIYNSQRNNDLLAVLFIDLDNFKYVNDSMGHNAGDVLIKIVSRRITRALRKTDTVARWGGDEFTVLLPKIKSLSDIFVLCKRILTEELDNIVIENQELRITASIGISVFPDDGDDAEELIKNADTAMYRAKDKGKNCYQLYKPKMNDQVLERIANESKLFHAIDKEEFLLVYQPQIDLSTNKITGFESLIRWNNPDKGVLAPYKFIPLAEETNLIIPLGQWIIENACMQNQKWHDKGYKITCAVNISGKQFMDNSIVQIIKRALKKSGLNPKYLELELTETILMDNVEHTVNILNELKAMGIQLSIDDFGTGYSSLSYLKKFPIDTLKIDQSFISDLTDTSLSNTTIANIVIDLGHKLGMKVIAEGVETEEQIEFLRRNTCDKIQGYVISEPVNEVEFSLLLKNNKI